MLATGPWVFMPHRVAGKPGSYNGRCDRRVCRSTACWRPGRGVFMPRRVAGKPGSYRGFSVGVGGCTAPGGTQMAMPAAFFWVVGMPTLSPPALWRP